MSILKLQVNVPRPYVEVLSSPLPLLPSDRRREWGAINRSELAIRERGERPYADAAPTTWPDQVVPGAADPLKGALYEKTPPSAAASQ